MPLTELHARLMSEAFERVLGATETGAMAYVRCLTGEIVADLAVAPEFSPKGWQVWRVADTDDPGTRTVSADRAVEMRESKQDATLLLVDTGRAGAGMDGIYSAAREVQEQELFHEALRLAAGEITKRLSREHRQFAELAVRRARSRGRRATVSPWTEFDFLARVAAAQKHPGEFLYLLGLWPMKHVEDIEDQLSLHWSVLFVERLLGVGSAAMAPETRIDALKLLNPTEDQLRGLASFLRRAAAKSLIPALSELADWPSLWVNALRVEGSADVIQNIELIPWRNRSGKVARWSGLSGGKEPEDPPMLILDPDAAATGKYSKLEVRWKVRPENLEKGAAEYRVVIVTDMEEELAAREVAHSAKKEEKCRFTDDDFSALSEDARIPARVVVSVVGNDQIESQESEEFVICFGEPPEQEAGGVGTKVRAFSEGLIDLDERDEMSTCLPAGPLFREDAKGFVLLRIPTKRKSFRVYRPPLIREVEEQWAKKGNPMGRWRVKVRSSGARAGRVEFLPFEEPEGDAGEFWPRTEKASRQMAERFGANGGGVGQVYDDKSRDFDGVREYLLAWAALLEADVDPELVLVNTVEVQSLSGRTIGLIVLPAHPLRVAWHVAYDNLVFHARFEQGLGPKDVREELKPLDGAMFPAFLPGVDGQGTFVFADTLGFHAVGMVSDRDKEPKAAIALLARALGESETADAAPTVGQQSAEVLGKEIIKYLECHEGTRFLHVHALRPGDGLSIARALGIVCEHLRKAETVEEDEEQEDVVPAFILELYPSESQRGVAGRFLTEVSEKRRSGAGVLSAADSWMLESLSLGGGVALPRLRWARRDKPTPDRAAHLAAAFDTFESQVVMVPSPQLPDTRPLFAFGLISFFERQYSSQPVPLWQSFIPVATEGEKHPSERAHTERLLRIQQAIHRAVARSLGGSDSDVALLRAEISGEKADDLRTLHELCDWVITVDRNAGIEYFDSPNDNPEIYDAYVIDCVPEREDLGCLQLITSTSNLDEVRNLLDRALDQMGLSRSLRNARFLLEHLKALSGRLAIRLTGQKAPTGELIALALVHANCREAQADDDAWTGLWDGFFIPVDDVRDLLPPLVDDRKSESERETRPDLIHVSLGPRGALVFRFVEVKYRRHLRTARNPETLQHIHEQTQNLRARWRAWYFDENLSVCQRAIRRAKLARVLRFYADKARRHHLCNEVYQRLLSEIDRMVTSDGGVLADVEPGSDRGFVFCPAYQGTAPLEVSPPQSETRIFLFGPSLLPDSAFRITPEQPVERNAAEPAVLPVLQTSDSAAGKLTSTQHPPERGKDTPSGAAERAGEQQLEVHLGEDVFANTPVLWQPSVKGHPHLLVVGLSGMGKTTCLINVCRQLHGQGVCPIVFSFHQDIDERLQDSLDDIRFVDYSRLGFNPLKRPAQESRGTYLDVAAEIRDIFMAIYPELGDIQGELIRKAIKESYLEQGWGGRPGEQLEGSDPAFGRFLEILHSTPKPDRGLRTLLARLDELADYGFFDTGEDEGSLWDSQRPVVIRVHSTQNDNLQRAFASLLFYGFYKQMFYRQPQEQISHFIVFDEAHRAARLRLIPRMAQECRKYGIGLVLASQQVRDFHVSLFSLIANYLVLRLTDQDAKTLVRNVTTSDQERSLVDRIKQMDRYRALFFCEGHRKPAYVRLAPREPPH